MRQVSGNIELVAEHVALRPPAQVELDPGQSLLVMQPRQSPALHVVPAAEQFASLVQAWVQVPGTPPTHDREPPQRDESTHEVALQVPYVGMLQVLLPHCESLVHWHLPDTHVPLVHDVVQVFGWQKPPLQVSLEPQLPLEEHALAAQVP